VRQPRPGVGDASRGVRPAHADPPLVTRMCRLAAIAGREQHCAEAGCTFWEPGGAVLAGRCMFERVDLAASPPLAANLIAIREQLDAALAGARLREAQRAPGRTTGSSSSRNA
jgi:hypothetical protein